MLAGARRRSPTRVHAIYPVSPHKAFKIRRRSIECGNWTVMGLALIPAEDRFPSIDVIFPPSHLVYKQTNGHVFAVGPQIVVVHSSISTAPFQRDHSEL